MAATKVKGTWDREADKFDEVPAGSNVDVGQHPERSLGTRSAVGVIDVGYVVGPDGTIQPAPSSPQDTLIAEDSGTPGIYYVGKAVIGSASSAALWQIKRINVISDTAPIDIDIGWADSNASYDNIWDDRQTLSYS